MVSNEDSPSGPDTASDILEFIRKHPGTHLREIKRKMNLAMGTIQYHLYNLERERKIVSRRKLASKQFYANLVFRDQQIDILGILSQDIEREILLYLIQNPRSSQKDLSEFLDRSPATTYWHVRKLNDAGLIATIREKEFVRYELTGNQSEILDLIKSYHPRIWETWAGRLADILTEVSGVDVAEQKRGSK